MGLFYTPGRNIGFIDISEHHLQSELQCTRRSRGKDSPEIGGIHIADRKPEVRVIGHVERFSPKLEPRCFS